jgi:superfamily II DNA or RNA helicase
MTTWFTADLHFGHRNIIEHRNRPCSDVDAMNRALIQNWNQVVGTDDTVWVVGVIVAPPGSGKTVLACALIGHHRLPTLVLVDRKPLLDQWRERLAEILGLGSDEVGSIGGGTNQPSGLVDVAMIQSVARLDHPPDLFADYGLVVVDECHHLPAVSFESTVRTRRHVDGSA